MIDDVDGNGADRGDTTTYTVTNTGNVTLDPIAVDGSWKPGSTGGFGIGYRFGGVMLALLGGGLMLGGRRRRAADGGA